MENTFEYTYAVSNIKLYYLAIPIALIKTHDIIIFGNLQNEIQTQLFSKVFPTIHPFPLSWDYGESLAIHILEFSRFILKLKLRGRYFFMF
jgi:hypothetical protein